MAHAQTPIRQPSASTTQRSTSEGGQAEADIVVTARATPGAVIGDIPPENQLNQADIASYGVGTVSELLDQIASQTQSGQGRDSDGPVVLVNGRRTSGVNEVGDLPTESIVRVDILPEEVALKYGYGAQQKVVNVILRRRFDARTAEASGGGATQGEGANAGAIGSYARIRGDDRINVSLRVKGADDLLESERGVSSVATTIDANGVVVDQASARTLLPRTRSYSLNGAANHAFGRRTTGSLNIRLERLTSNALQGPATTASVIEGGESETASSMDALARDSSTTTAHLGTALNSELSTDWKLSATGGYDHVETRTSGDRGADGMYGATTTQRTVLVSDAVQGGVVVMGRLFSLPAGRIRTSVRAGGDFTSLRSASDFPIGSNMDADRSDLNGQVSLDLPIASRKEGFLAALGTLTANVNAGATSVSDFGTLATLGYGLNWTPATGASFIASITQDRRAPTLEQLAGPMVSASGVRTFDYVAGRTVEVTQTTGGNWTLKADDRKVMKLATTIKPIRGSSFSITANYLSSSIRNPIGSLTGATSLAEAAFPERFARDASGSLVSIDATPVNFQKEDRSELRWGVNLSRTLRKPSRPPRRDFAGGRPSSTLEGLPSLVRSGGRTSSGSDLPDGASPSGPTTSGKSSIGSAPSDAAGVDGEDIVVTGRRTASADDRPSDGPPPGMDDGNGPPDGPPPDGGPGGDGPPPGGFGGGGGPGGPGGRGPGGPGANGGNGAQLQMSVYHTWTIRDRVTIAEGVPEVDLLSGGTIGGAAISRHQAQFNAGVMDNGIGVRLSGSWRSGSTVQADEASSTGDLRFSSLATFDLRIFANLANRMPRSSFARGTRVQLAVTNVFGTRQTVRDSAGSTPVAYQPAYLDPLGRTVLASIRRIF